MRGCRKRRSLWLAGVMAAAPFAPVRAQEAPSPVWALEGETGVVSDYRYRGASLSDEASAWQAGLTVSRPGGLYGDLHVSTIAAYGGTEDEDGAHIEAALTLGWAGSLGDFAVDAAVTTYQYPGGVDVAYAEIPVQIGQTRGPLTWTLGAAWAPAGQTALGNRDNRYVWGGLDLAHAAWPITLHGALGFEDGAYAPDGKTDWRVGMTAPLGSIDLGLDYVDSDVATGALVVRLFIGF